jgi:hypothetical protein
VRIAGDANPDSWEWRAFGGGWLARGRDVTADHDNKFRAPCLDRRDKLTLAGQIADYSETQRHML